MRFSYTYFIFHFDQANMSSKQLQCFKNANDDILFATMSAFHPESPGLLKTMLQESKSTDQHKKAMMVGRGSVVVYQQAAAAVSRRFFFDPHPHVPIPL